MLFLPETKDKFPDLKHIFEVGAHRGYDIPEILEQWPEAIVYAFEADPFNYEICKNKFADYDNVHVYHMAVTDTTGKVTFNRFYDLETIPDEETMVGANLQNTGQGSILKCGRGMKELFKVGDPVKEIEVDGITLKDFCLENNIPTIDALFMDVQGAEMHVFNGCGDMLDTTSATIFEWSSQYIMYDGEADFNYIKMFLEIKGFKEDNREYQLQGISGDSLFTR
tara:strand:+ start:686 stop:1357 length:672 start_codon:yes stop_codon:yes gene_type:complete